MLSGTMKLACGRAHILSFPSSATTINHFRTTTTTNTNLSFTTTQSQTSIKMSAAANPPQEIIEHIVLFKVKSDIDQSKVNAMVNNLNGLSTLDSVLHITAGPVFRNRSSALTFTHMLHSRYSSKSDLDTYTNHPAHVGVVTDYVRPIVDDVMAVDWIANNELVSGSGSVSISPGSAVRVSFMKLKENLGENERNEILGVIGGIKEKFPAIKQLSYGENFSPARAKGFSIASLAVFNGVNELEGLDSESEAANEHKDKVRDKLDGVVVLDYIVPSSQSASL